MEFVKGYLKNHQYSHSHSHSHSHSKETKCTVDGTQYKSKYKNCLNSHIKKNHNLK